MNGKRVVTRLAAPLANWVRPRADLHYWWRRPRARLALILVAAQIIAVGGCSRSPKRITGPADGPGKHPVHFANIPDAKPRREHRSRYGNPRSYKVFGKTYETWPSARGYVEKGIASWYGSKFHGARTSSGEPFDMYAMTAAHKHLPLPTYVRVTNLENGRSIVVKVNDRGPFHENRIIDLSWVAAGKLGYSGKGTALVEVRALDPGHRPKPPPPPPRTAADEPNIFVQAGAFSSRENAERLRLRIGRNIADPIRIQPVRINKRRIWRVQVGPLAQVGRADAVTERLHGMGIQGTSIVID